MSATYTEGAGFCLKVMGLTKLSQDDQEDPNRSVVDNLAVGAAGVAPLGGLIGQKPIIHDPFLGAKGKNFRSMQDLGRAAQAGDVLVTSKPSGSIWKHVISPFGGSEFYHAQPVIHRRNTPRGPMGTTTSAGEMYFDDDLNLSQRKGMIGTVPEEMAEAGYSDAVLLRPKNLNKQQARAVGDASMGRAHRNYDMPTAVKAWLKDVFVPKIDSIGRLGKQTVCEGNVCSTMPSQALYDATGTQTLPGKRPRDIMPVDLLRSEEYELIGSRITDALKKKAPAPWLYKARPALSRAGLGAGLAGTTYLAQENPEMLGVAPGAAAANLGATAAAKKLLGDEWRTHLPSAWDAVESVMANPVKYKKDIIRFGTRRLPIMAAGAGLGYLGSKKLTDLVRGPENSNQ